MHVLPKRPRLLGPGRRCRGIGDLPSIGVCSHDRKPKAPALHAAAKRATPLSKRIASFATRQPGAVMPPKARQRDMKCNQIIARNIRIISEFAMTKKNAPTRGTMRNAKCEGPWRCVTAVMFAIAVVVPPRANPMKPADTTAAS